MMGKKLLLPLLCGLLLLLTGCYHVNADLTISPDDTISGTVTMTVPAKTNPAQQKEIFKTVDSIDEATITVEKLKQKGKVGRKLVLSNTPIGLVFGSSNSIRLTKSNDGHVLRGSFPEYNELPILKTKPQPKTKKKKKQPAKEIKAKPNWNISIIFPQSIKKASEGIAVVGSKATVSNEFFEQGVQFEILTGNAAAETVVVGVDEEKYEPKAPPAVVAPPIPEPRSTIPTTIFTLMILGGLAAAIGGRFVNFGPILHWSREKKNRRAAKKR